MPEALRLQVILAQAGVASRRASEGLIEQRRVEVDGEIVTEFGTRYDPATAVIRVDGKRIPPRSAHRYVLLNKPAGVVTTMTDPHGRRCVGDLVGRFSDTRLVHVGRLDADTEGLLLLTNHGELTHRLTHPSFEVAKTYVAEVEGAVTKATVRTLLAGVRLDDGPIAADAARITAQHGDRTLVEVRLHSGRNRIVRRLLGHVGHPVIRLSRIAIGPLRRGSLRSGQARDLTADEVGELLDLVGL